MIDDFAQAFLLFAPAWGSALLLATLLPFVGVVLLLRQQVFLAAAIGQAASLGYALALWLGLAAAGGHGHDVSLLLAGWVLAVFTAVTALRALTTRGTDMEARAGVVFLLGGSLGMVLLADAPHGLAEVQRMFLSSLLGAGGFDVAVAAGLLVATVAVAARRGRTVALWAIDPTTAAAHGLPVRALDLGVGLWVGTVLAFAIHVGGLVFAFGAAVLPTLFAREVCRSLRAVAITAPVAGAVFGAVGLWLAHTCDRPPGQTIVAVLAIAALSARPAQWLRRQLFSTRP